MKRLRYAGEGIICQFGEFRDGWEGEVQDTAAERLLAVPGFTEVQEGKDPAGSRKTKDKNGGE